jgi:predicted transglutaminase-like cysteine proteinase
MRGSLIRLQRRLLLLAAILLPVLIPLLLVANFGKPDVAPVPIAVVDAPDRTKDGPAASLATDRDEPRVGDVQILPSFKTISHSIVRSELKRHEPASRSIVFSSNSTGAMTFVAAPSLNWMLSVPNAYLLGRVPYAVSQAWMPLYAVSDRLRYRLDHDQFSGREEVWLTSMQAWSRAQGDCEDHAILLADWLMDLGLDARVVLGKHVKEGHAWVVVFKDGKEYLLEATLKKKLKRWSAYPLASVLPDYHPEIMFNRDLLWFNTGSNLTVSYSGSQWRQAVRFLPTEAL